MDNEGDAHVVNKIKNMKRVYMEFNNRQRFGSRVSRPNWFETEPFKTFGTWTEQSTGMMDNEGDGDMANKIKNMKRVYMKFNNRQQFGSVRECQNRTGFETKPF